MSGASWSDWFPVGEGVGGKPLEHYAAWSKQIDGETVSKRALLQTLEDRLDDGLKEFRVSTGSSAFTAPSLNPQFLRIGPAADDGTRDIGRAVEDIVQEQLSSFEGDLPDFAHNEDYEEGDDWFSTIDVGQAPEKDAVIVGVIDRGIALGHRAQQMENGDSRILAAWQQVAPNVKPHRNEATSRIPFGMALLNADINNALVASRTTPTDVASTDEQAFNRLVGSEDYAYRSGHRELGAAVAHGSHVLDAVAGSWQGLASEEAFKQLVRPVVVNLPNRDIIGLDSRHLEAFVQLGILWTVLLADNTWFAAHGDSHEGQEGKGYRIVINLSFAKQAGAKDGDDAISKFVQTLNTLRKDRIPIHLVVPTGNDNLSRTHARIKLPARPVADKTDGFSTRMRAMKWRVSPGDQSSNYVEVWSTGKMRGDGTIASAIAIQVCDPDGIYNTLHPPDTDRVSYLSYEDGGDPEDIKPYAAIYSDAKKRSPDDGSYLMRHLVCVAPTQLHDGISPEAKAGVWTITVDNLTEQETLVTFDIQTDQSSHPGSNRSKPSYFEDESYLQFDPKTGARLDTYDYPRAGPPKDNDNIHGKPGRSNGFTNRSPIQRHGTMNALAGQRANREGDGDDAISVVGGFRVSDGKPAIYSSTGWVELNHASGSDPVRPHCAFPSDDGASHFGRLSSGSSDGSVRAMQGTSFACAQMTRLIAKRLVADPSTTPGQVAKGILSDAARQQSSVWNGYGQTHPAKTGNGRLSDPSVVRYRVSRLIADDSVPPSNPDIG